MHEINARHQKTFESIQQEGEDGSEYWSARDLQPILEYSSWQNFEAVIQKAMKACANSGVALSDHFNDVIKMVPLGSGSKRKVSDYHLSRYACYLIVQNADSEKSVIAASQTYFAMQTRRQELADVRDFQQLDEGQQRPFLCEEPRKHNKQLGKVASQYSVRGRPNFAIFQNHGYRGLYGGLRAKDIHSRKGLKKSQHILAHMGSTELAANLFCATQAEEKLRRENIEGKDEANQAHYDVGAKVRKTIEDLGGTMPEELPTPETSVKKQQPSSSQGKQEDQ